MELVVISEVEYSIVIIIIIRYINLYTEPGIEATACARELLYVYVYVYVCPYVNNNNNNSWCRWQH